ncbi:Selenoprotein S (SelS) [Popillia japonica]|uniref:Selenoprotein S (SelS) n=1 Tax=Popillia japonica TaxID=7064 RepID=A0AAW1N3A1_POPJA
MDDMQNESDSIFIVRVIENYGWYILISTAVILYIINLFKPKINKYFEWKNEQDYIAKYHKDPDLFSRRLEIQRNRVELLQKRHEKDAEIYQRKLKERDAKKLEEIAKKYENANIGQKLGSSIEASKSLKPDYNPLMGDSSRSYRPVKKSPCGGKGCGR